MKNSNWIYLIILVITFNACKQVNSDNQTTSAVEPQTIKLFAQARPGGEHFDFDMPIDKGLDKLKIISAKNLELENDELVLGFSTNTSQFAIPIKYLSGFEVANLVVDTNQYLLTWCPLVGSARIFDGKINDDLSGFDFGRGLRDNNLLIVDRKTKSVWNQLSCKAIEGELTGEKINPFPSIQSTWSFWKNKYPDTKAIINTDTSNAVFPQFIMEKPYYSTWVPGEKFPNDEGHNIEHLGLGVELGNSAVFFPFEKLFKETSPINYEWENQQFEVHFDKSGMTAWVEDEEGNLLPNTIVYEWAWTNFFPETNMFEN
ncbi:MAG: DUF3179 domain-containing (seleno)protein [Saprospiraceae bacterium]|nr:DUF3179 domain-containing (seleno)protein [Saprospiraceae bacterium]